jgi:hypothetical protein
MNHNTKHEEEKMDSFFRELYKRCKQKHVYSVMEAVQEMGLDYAEIIKWAESNERRVGMLQMCRQSCSINAEIDAMNFILPADKAFKYLFECDDDYIALYPTPEEQEAVIENLKKDIMQKK